MLNRSLRRVGATYNDMFYSHYKPHFISRQCYGTNETELTGKIETRKEGNRFLKFRLDGYVIQTELLAVGEAC